MAQPDSASKLDIRGLITIPAVLTLAVTLLRLAGELMHGPPILFNSAPGGAWALVGIIWLVPVFGIYFGLKLTAQGERPRSIIRALGFPFLAIAVISFAGPRLNIQQNFRERLFYGYAVFAVAALVAWPGWPALFRILLAYAYAARVPVAIVVWFALWRQLGTHYDAPPADIPAGMGLLTKYLWIGFFPQLVFWVAVTLVVGMLFGGLAAAAVLTMHRLPRAALEAEVRNQKSGDRSQVPETRR